MEQLFCDSICGDMAKMGRWLLPCLAFATLFIVAETQCSCSFTRSDSLVVMHFIQRKHLRWFGSYCQYRQVRHQAGPGSFLCGMRNRYGIAPILREPYSIQNPQPVMANLCRKCASSRRDAALTKSNRQLSGFVGFFGMRFSLGSERVQL